jgi:hypothetical protein
MQGHGTAEQLAARLRDVFLAPLIRHEHAEAHVSDVLDLIAARMREVAAMDLVRPDERL